jgi:metal-responsive CopG/Arc/MetJ family transcriptional regulator
MKPTTVYLPEETAANLQKLAKKTGRSLEELIQEAVENYLTKQTSSLPKSVGMGASGMSNLAERSEELLWKDES